MPVYALCRKGIRASWRRIGTVMSMPNQPRLLTSFRDLVEQRRALPLEQRLLALGVHVNVEETPDVSDLDVGAVLRVFPRG